ncbi:hypothetical protein [Undibacterium terreum]|uniref:Uncharacterized protein n=1 Tax=Undibacterium terreum TaxID=1224302 RepID=A0A916XAM2_9BURK|nr:hypothetical protein [Undibacterium terreum]GGC59969.1 hypothetical protein GCM10011396_03580 [Undibacterium terreum]
MNKLKFAAVAGVVGLIAALAGCGGFVYTTVGGSVTGLTSTDSTITNTLVLRNDANYTQTLSADGTFAFNVASDASYTISVLTQPTTVFCTVANGTGHMTGSGSVTNVKVTCVPSVQVGGTLNGMNTGASMTLENNINNTDTTLQDSKTLSVNGVFTFPKYMPTGKPYDFSVYIQPVAQNCTITNGTGVADNTKPVGSFANIASVNCVQAVPVSVALSGLAAGGTIVFQNNGDTNSINMITQTINGNFTFNQSMVEGQAYNVTVGTQPAGQICTVTNGSGIAHLANPAGASNIPVTCVNK